MPDVLDIAYPPGDPSVLVADAQAARTRAVGLYALNLSILDTVQEPTYAQAVKILGMGVYPIVVPSNTPPPVASVVHTLETWGVPHNAPVMIDLERGSLPPTIWVQEMCRAWTGAGIYCQAGYRAQYEVAHPAFWWLAAWNGDPSIPDGWQAHQYGSFIGPSGKAYDASSVSPALHFWGEKEEDMPNRSYFTLVAGDPDRESVVVPGVNNLTNWNAVAQGVDSQLVIQSWDQNGDDVTSGLLPQVLQATPPKEVFGQGFGLTGPGSVRFFCPVGKIMIAVGW